MDETTLVHVGIAASDLERSVQFWRDVLGLRVAATQPGCYDLTDGHHNFRLFQYQGGPRPPQVSGLATYLHVGVKVGDLPTALRRCAAHGVTVLWGEVDAPLPYDPEHPPENSFKVADPDGIVVDVTGVDGQWPGVTLRPAVTGHAG